MADIEIEIDGRKLIAKPNQMVIQVADEAGIYIPRFCYHKHLSIAANCRMCLVEIEKSPKALPACATPVTPGMKIFTHSTKTIEAQRAVMEFLLINHPLDCPICDQGGECELQDLSMGYGSSHSHYTESKRAVPDLDLGPLIATEMTRCIYCTRCVRFGEEIAGMREMGGTYRGEYTEIGTFVKHAMRSEVSGNIIDLCPVGALTSKPYRFTARPWELDQAPSISPHDCLGSHLYVHTRYGKVMRVVAREKPEINETWLSDRDRFSYTALYHQDRLEEPIARIDGQWNVVDWQQALEMVASSLHDVIAEAGSDKLGALASPSATLEEFYLLQKIVRGLGSPHVDHRLRESDISPADDLGLFQGLNISLNDLEHCDAIVLIGSNIQKEQPLAALRIRRATLKDAVVVAINPFDYQFNFDVYAKKIVAPHQLPEAVAHWSELRQLLQGKKNVCILLGALSLHHPQASYIRSLAYQLAKPFNAKVGLLTDGANAAGAWLAGAIPHRQAGGVAIHHQGLHAYAMLEKARKGYILLNVEPDLDCANASLATAALKQAKFVLALSMYRNPVLEACAHVILPITPFTETSGTYVNAMGEWQSFIGVAKAYRSARPAWKALCALGNFLHLSGFHYDSSLAIRDEVRTLVDRAPTLFSKTEPMENKSQPKATMLSRVGEVPLYAIDSIVRRSEPLQKTQAMMEGEVASARLHAKTAQRFKLQHGDKALVKQGSTELCLPVIIDARLPEDAVWIAGGIHATSGLGDLFGEVTIEKAS